MLLWKNKNANISAKFCKAYANFSNPDAADAFVGESSRNAYVVNRDGSGNGRAFTKSGNGSGKLRGDFGFSGGCLVCAPSKARVLDDTVFGAADRPDGGFVYCTNYATIARNSSGKKISCDAVFDYPVILNCGKTGATVVTQTDYATYVFADDQWQQAADFGFDSLAWHRERVFGADGSNILRFTECCDFLNWSGEITFPCKIYGVASCGDYIFAVGESIFEIDFDDITEDTKIREVFVGLGKVFGKTVAAVGDRLFFLTPRSLCRYKNGKVTTIRTNVDINESNPDACAAVTDGRYWLSLAEVGSKSCNTVLEVEASALPDGQNQAPKVLCCHDISTAYLFGGKRLLFDVDTRPFTFSSGHTDFVWRSRAYSFGTRQKKFLRKLAVKTDSAVSVTLFADGAQEENAGQSGAGWLKTFDFEGGDVMSEIPVSGVFRTLAVKIESKDNAAVDALEIACELQTE